MDADAPPTAPGRPSGDPRGPAPVGDQDPWKNERPDTVADDARGPAMARGEGSPPPDSKPAVRERNPWRWVGEWAAVLVVALAVALGVRAFVVQTFYIPSPSMVPTLMVGDRILVDKLSYHLHAVHRGDIVVFGRPPGEPASENVKDLVKRVVGLPKETIWSSDGNVYVRGPDTRGHVIEIPEPVKGTSLGQPIPRRTLGPDAYFVLGDNRTNSSDSRVFGPIPGSLIVGRVVMRIWPVTQLAFF